TKKITYATLRDADIEKIGEPGPEFPLPWEEGQAVISLNTGSSWYRHARLKLGFPLLCGLSGTTMRMIMAFSWLKVPNCRARDFINALIAWMVSGGDHTIYEILRAIRMATPLKSDEGRAEYSKRCLISDPREQKHLESLTGLLKLGAATAYPRMEQTLLGRAPLTELTEQGYELLIRSDKWQFLSDRMIRKIKRIYRCVLAVTDYNVRPDTPYQEDDTPEDASFVEYRIVRVSDWLKYLKVNGTDLAQTLGISHVYAIFAYTTHLYVIINDSTLFSVKKLQDEIWQKVERSLTPRGIVKSQGKFPQFFSSPEILKLFREVVEAKNETEKKKLKARLRAEFYNSRHWEAAKDEANTHAGMAARALRVIPNPPAGSETVTFRGAWRLPLLDIPDIVAKKFTTKGLLSCSSDRRVAVQIARKYHDMPAVKPVVAEFTNGALAGKSISGLSDQPTEAEFLVGRGVKFTRNSIGDKIEEGFKFVHVIHEAQL
ncbi:hypothetical protein ACWCRG_43245, partial [Streptomyces formicae]